MRFRAAGGRGLSGCVSHPCCFPQVISSASWTFRSCISTDSMAAGVLGNLNSENPSRCGFVCFCTSGCVFVKPRVTVCYLNERRRKWCLVQVRKLPRRPSEGYYEHSQVLRAGLGPARTTVLKNFLGQGSGFQTCRRERVLPLFFFSPQAILKQNFGI